MMQAIMEAAKIWLAVIAVVGLQGSGANATTIDFDVTVSCPTCIFTSGTTTDVTTPLGGGEYLVTSILGTIGGFSSNPGPRRQHGKSRQLTN